jgi:hypothetical protein
MKRTRPFPRCISALVVAAVGSALATLPMLPASAVPQGTPWEEQGDAGSILMSAQVVKGIGPVSSIRGQVDQPEDEDMFRICITGGKSFSAATVEGAVFDTQLFLFDRRGRGVFANDDSVGTLQSTLPAGDSLTPQAGGKHYLAISSYNNDPVSTRGLIFPSAPFGDVFGPTGPGGQLPVSDWTNSGFGSGDYLVELTGARSCGGPTG